MSEDRSNQSDFSPLETGLGTLAVKQGLATSQDVQECLDYQKHSSDPNQRSLGDIFVERGVLTQRQVDRLRQVIEQRKRHQEIPGYELLGKLGAGAMATVFKARQLSLDRVVAIKVLPRRLSENPEYVARFYEEGKAAGRLNHPNIVQAIDVGQAGGYHYFVMEYVDGHTVFDELADGKIFSESEALDIIIQIAEALTHAHQAGLIHRDIKPKNIMLTRDRVAKLADMGLAREANDMEAAKRERGRAFGTPYYISPEQIRGKTDVGFQADIYGLGATFYHMVTGRVPFEGETPAAVMHKHLKEPLVPPDHLNTSLSAGVGEVIEVMMDKDAHHRYASTADLLVDLRAVQRGEPPLQARQVIAGDVLSGLTSEAPALRDDPQPAETDSRIEPSVPTLWMTVTILLAAALALSILLNVVQALNNG